jgi:hypothetical protein
MAALEGDMRWPFIQSATIDATTAIGILADEAPHLPAGSFLIDAGFIAGLAYIGAVVGSCSALQRMHGDTA